MNQRFEAHGVDASEQLLSEAYAEMSLERRDAAPIGMTLFTSDLGTVRFDRLRTNLAFDADVEPLERWLFGQVHAGSAIYTTDREPRVYRPGEALLIAQPDVTYHTRIEDVDISVAVVDPSVVDQVAQTGGDRSGPVRFTDYRPIDASAHALFSSTLGYLQQTFTDAADAAQHPLVVSGAARMLVSAALAAFPNTASLEPTAIDRNDAHPLTVRRAVEYIEANAHRDISVADIAAAAFVTIRAIQLAFRRHLGTTPLSHLRRVRLQRARDELRASDPARITVGAVARRWGFADASRFARQYGEAFGELPSATLRS